MEHVWSEYEGKSVDDYSLDTFLGVREGKAFYVTKREHSTALLQVTESDKAQLTNWRRAERLSHDNLMRVYSAENGLLEGQNVVYSVTEIPDDDLSEILPKRTLHADEATTIIAAVANALEYLHSKGLQHGSVVPANIFDVGSAIKLGIDTVAPDGDPQTDIRQLGATLVEILTGTSPLNSGEPDEKKSALLQRLHPPLREIAAGCLAPGTTWTATNVLQRLGLRPENKQPEPQPVRTTPKISRWAWAAVGVGTLWIVGFVSTRSSSPVAKPAPVVERTPEPSAPPPKSAPPVVTRSRSSREVEPIKPGWAVIAATYRNASGAEKRAASIRGRWPKFHVGVVYAGDQSRYFVVIGSGLSKGEAQNLHRRAVSAGFPRDTYMTSFRNG